MSNNFLRWQITTAVRRILLRTPTDHPLRKAYRAARRMPLVTQVWRLIDTGAPPSQSDFEAYVEAGGKFGPAIADDGGALPEIVEFNDPAFFSSLIARITLCEPKAACERSAVLLVNNGLSAGGAERQIVSTMLGLKRRHLNAGFVGEYMDGVPGQDFYLPVLREAGCAIHPFARVTRPNKRMFENISRPVAEQISRAPLQMLLEILDMARLFRAQAPRIVHLWQDETSIKYAISGLIAGVPRIILSGRNINPTHFGYHQPYMRAAYRALSGQAAIVMTNNSRAGAESYSAWLGLSPSAIRVIHNGTDFSKWPDYNDQTRQQTRRTLGVRETDALVLGVFRLSPEKRPMLWLDIAKQVAGKNRDVQFVIAGDGGMRPEVEANLASNGLSERIKLVGQVQDLSGLYMAADAVLLVSAFEGVPNVVLEAQLYGRPVLATPAGGVPEAILPERTGRLGTSDEAQALANQLLQVIRDTALKTSSLNEGPAFVRSAFSQERMIEDTLALYDV